VATASKTRCFVILLVSNLLRGKPEESSAGAERSLPPWSSCLCRSLTTAAGSLHPSNDEPDHCNKAHPGAQTM